MSFDAPRAVHYDATRAINVDNAATPAAEIAAGDNFRIFGRNLYVNSAANAVTPGRRSNRSLAFRHRFRRERRQ